MSARGAPFLFALAAVLAAAAPASAAPLANQLRGHPSPYLAMHAGDPVAWQEWGRPALERARREGKLVFLSIGYFTCHWCHVMQRESFRDGEIARFINRHFVPVKVDRELEPALDARLIEFAQKTRGQAGWPLNVFLTPDGHPLFATLYEPPQRFLQSLTRLQALWAEDPQALRRLATQEAQPLDGPGKPEVEAERAVAYARKAVADALRAADWQQGGFGDASKFPSVPQLDFLLALVADGSGGRVREFLALTLDNMVQRGLYDHLGGGFFRYTTDADWKTPHFEKMLCDNALLVRLYLRGARVLGRPDYARVAHETLDFMVRELRSADGGMIAALSAVDDRNIEGGYYLWTVPELAARLEASELRAFRVAYGIADAPPFERGYLPYRVRSDAEAAQTLGLDSGEVVALLASGRAKLFEARQARSLPRDGKRLAGWNGLALAAFAEAARELNDARYREVADALRRYLMRSLWDGERLWRAVSNERGVGTAALEDYAYTALGLLEWARLTGEEADYRNVRTVVAAAWKRFHGARSWRLGDDSLLVGEQGQDLVADAAMPSPAAVLARVTLELAARFSDAGLRRQTLAALNSGHRQLADEPFLHVTHIGAMLAASGVKE